MNTQNAIRNITPQSLYLLREANAPVEIIEVSTPNEFREYHVPGARNLPIGSPKLNAFMANRLNPHGAPVYVMCRGGVRSVKVCNKFHAANLVNVEGGTKAWKEELPLKKDHSVLSLERQVRIVAGGLVLVGSVLALVAHPYFVGIAAFVGAGLFVAGVTNTCGMAMLLARMPWNTMTFRRSHKTNESFSH